MERSVLLLDSWYQCNYGALKNSAFVVTENDKDSFHDAYLGVRKFVKFCGKEIRDFAPYFMMEYRKMKSRNDRNERRYAHPDEYFFEVMVDEEGLIEEKEAKEKECADILNFVKRRFPNDYRMFCLRVIKPGCTYRELSIYMGMPVKDIRDKMIRIKETIRKEFRYGA